MLSLDSFRLATAMFLVFLLLLSTNSKAYSFSWGTTPAILRPQTNFQKSAHIFASTVTKSTTSNNDDAARQDSSEETNSGDDHDDPTEGITEILQTSNVRIDDGGSALTDRFKYKVNALMGVFVSFQQRLHAVSLCTSSAHDETRPHLHDHTTMQDPADAANDNEQDKGNILNAMLRFPLEFSFHVVGKTGGDSNVQEEFVEQVKTIAKTTTSSDEVVCKITPRGSKFTKVTLQVQVESADAINSIYDQLGELELSVMHF